MKINEEEGFHFNDILSHQFMGFQDLPPKNIVVFDEALLPSHILLLYI